MGKFNSKSLFIFIFNDNERQHLLDALNDSETVGHMASKTVTLIMLGKLFELTEAQYSQKILSTALTIAKKMKHSRFIQLCSLMLNKEKQSVLE